MYYPTNALHDITYKININFYMSRYLEAILWELNKCIQTNLPIYVYIISSGIPNEHRHIVKNSVVLSLAWWWLYKMKHVAVTYDINLYDCVDWITIKSSYIESLHKGMTPCKFKYITIRWQVGLYTFVAIRVTPWGGHLGAETCRSLCNLCHACCTTKCIGWVIYCILSVHNYTVFWGFSFTEMQKEHVYTDTTICWS
jgi:hypothetical protein